jgi:hypothetical protein
MGVKHSFPCEGNNTDEVTGEWRKFLSEEVLNSYSTKYYLVDHTRKMRFVGHVVCIGEKCILNSGWKS